MADLAWNVACWDGRYDWKAGGEEWSEFWGGSEPQWFGSLYPRLHRFLPAKSVLEIAPGFGRWTKFLIPNSARYIGVDLSQECVDACRRIFSNIPHATFIKNDGLSLSEINNASSYMPTLKSSRLTFLRYSASYPQTALRSFTIPTPAA